MKILEKTIKKNGFLYKQVERTDKAAIYAQHDGGGPPVAFEVFKIRKYPTRVIEFKGRGPRTFEAHEGFPGNEEFGTKAWTYKELGEAQKKHKEIK